MRPRSLQALLSTVLLLGAIGHVNAQSAANPVAICGLKEKEGCTYKWDFGTKECVATCKKKGAGSGGHGGSGETSPGFAKTSGKSSSGIGPGVSSVGKQPKSQP